LLGNSELILKQILRYDQDDMEGGTIDIEMAYAGQAWVGVGYNRDGRMVGSTVVIGFPDKPFIEGKNPGRYYLGNKNIKFIRPADSDDAPVTETGSRGDDDWFVWRRQLYDPGQMTERLLQISDASITQNDTHTILKFSRPLKIDDENNATTVHPEDFNTFIYAVGRGNGFGYHFHRGSRTIQFSNTCPQGIVSSFANESEPGLALDQSGGQPETQNQSEGSDNITHDSTKALDNFTNPSAAAAPSGWFHPILLNVCAFYLTVR
jgi:hypothetical protein